MFKIDMENNNITPLRVKKFSDLGLRERSHLQEWICKNPSCLGEDLLIIQKEFSGFSDTMERLDLLAIDKHGSLIIIENKLDDTGRDVTWQALKYASYCSGLLKEDIRKIYQEFLDQSITSEKAEEKLMEFFDGADYEDIILNKGVSQRIILIAANFRKEVTSTVLWLSTSYNMQIQCFEVTPYTMGDNVFLSIEQIIPVKGSEDYMIGLAKKTQNEISEAAQEKNRHKVRRQFWTDLLAIMNKKSSLYQNISPRTDAWIGAGSGLGGIGLNFVAGRAYGRAELYIDRGDKEENKYIYDWLLKRKDEIQSAFGEPQLIWEPLENRRACRIKAEVAGNIFEQEQWLEMIAFMTDAMIRMESAFRKPLKDLNAELKRHNQA